MNNESDELSPQERPLFERLERTRMPPEFIERQTIKALKDADLIRANSFGWFSGRSALGLAFAASLGFFVLGILVGAWSVSAQQPEKGLPEFILVLRASPGMEQPKSREELQQRVKEYTAWARALEKKGLLLGGEKLKQDGRLLTRLNGSTSIVSTRSNTSVDGIGGYFLLQAVDYDRASEIARSCPHLTYGGTIEIRQIERF